MSNLMRFLCAVMACMLCFCAFAEGDATYDDIGREFGGRDHSTAMHNVKKISEDMVNDPELTKTVKEIISNIKKG